MNRIAATLAGAYRDGFRRRFTDLAASACRFAQHARWCPEHDCYTGLDSDMEYLARAAFELWKWERDHIEIIAKTPDPFSSNEFMLVDAAIRLGDCMLEGHPGGPSMNHLLAQAAAFAGTTKGA